MPGPLTDLISIAVWFIHRLFAVWPQEFLVSLTIMIICSVKSKQFTLHGLAPHMHTVSSYIVSLVPNLGTTYSLSLLQQSHATNSLDHFGP